ncbi:B-box zinc finger protein 32 [Rhododendron vialii]|uniref:B-box zinc finger protein 32 n=1 Tax=Rhododendron vialii TaxID=182163 RepID=UPI00265D8B80|nr:B-box zinc finger protein 32 [Rhododendron vialii]
MKGCRGCDLCIREEAALYCPSDSAYLCWNCDAKLHQVNFLVARHVRCPLCSKCKCLITENHMSGSGFIQPHPHQLTVCRLCSHKDSSQADNPRSLSYFNFQQLSSCSSYAESSSTPPPKRSSVLIDLNRLKMDKIVSSSSSVMELSSSTRIAPTSKKAKTSTTTTTTTRESKVITTALRSWPSSSITKNVEHSKAVEVEGFASLWFSWRLCGASTWQVLKRLEEISGVPAKLIFAAGESKLTRVLSNKRRRSKSNRCHDQPEEGWAETQYCST